MKRIVVGLDGTPKDESVARWVADLAAGLGAHIVAARRATRRCTTWCSADWNAGSST
jgi:hypothetical protein